MWLGKFSFIQIVAIYLKRLLSWNHEKLSFYRLVAFLQLLLNNFFLMLLEMSVFILDVRPHLHQIIWNYNILPLYPKRCSLLQWHCPREKWDGSDVQVTDFKWPWVGQIIWIVISVKAPSNAALCKVSIWRRKGKFITYFWKLKIRGLGFLWLICLHTPFTSDFKNSH